MPDDTSNTQNNDTQNQNNSNDSNTSQQQNNTNKEVVLGCDSNGINDAECQATVHKALEAAGYKVHDLGINPDDFANYSYSGDAKGKFGVYLMAASLISFLDASDANFDLNVLGIRGDVTGWSDEEWKTKPVPKDHDGNYSHPRYDECEGNTYPQLNEKFKGKCIAVPGETPEKLAQNIIEALGGQYAGAGGGTSGGGAQIKDKTFEHCVRRICAATDSVFLIENNAAVLFPYTDWMAFTLREKINQIQAKDMDPDLFSIEYNNEGFYNKVTTVFGADEEEDNESDKDKDKDKQSSKNKNNNKNAKQSTKNDKQNEEEVTKNGNTTKKRKTMPTGGTQLSEQYDPLVKVYGELEKKVTTNFPDEETAQYVTNALLIQYIRDFNNSCRVRALNNQKYIGGTFYAVENPNTNESELFYLNSYTMFKTKDQPITVDIEFKYGPEGAEELLDYQTYGGGGGGQTNSAGSATEDEIWKHAKNFCHTYTCPELKEEEAETTDPKVAEEYVNKKEKAGTKRICLSCYGMSSWLYFQFNNKANIPARVIGNDSHHVIELYKNNAWYKPVQEYRQLDYWFHYDDFCQGNAPVLLDAPNSPAGGNTANASGNTADQNKTNTENK